MDDRPGPTAHVVGRGRLSAVPIWALILLVGVSGIVLGGTAVALVVGVPFTLLAVFGIGTLIHARVWVDGPVLYSAHAVRPSAGDAAGSAPPRALVVTYNQGRQLWLTGKDGTTCASTPPTCASSGCTRRWRRSSARSTASRTSGCFSGWRNTVRADGTGRRCRGRDRAARRGSGPRGSRGRSGSGGSTPRGCE